MVAASKREERQFWVLKWDGTVRPALGLSTGAAGYWWFPDVGEPGWGTSMQVGSGCFETRDLALTYAMRQAEQSLRLAYERIDRIKQQMESGL